MDIELIIESQNGNNEAFEQLIKQTRPLLEKLAVIKLKEKYNDYKDDVICNTELRIYKKIKTLNNLQSYKYWVIRIFTNECNKIFLREKMKKELTNQEDILSNEYDYSLDMAESNRNFEDLIKDLKEDEKQIFRLYFYDNYTLEEIAKILNINENTTRSKFRRGKEKIKKFIKTKKILLILMIGLMITSGIIYALSNNKHINNYIVFYNKNRVSNVDIDFIDDNLQIKIVFNEKVDFQDFNFEDKDRALLIGYEKPIRYYYKDFSCDNNTLIINYKYGKKDLPDKMILFIRPITEKTISFVIER